MSIDNGLQDTSFLSTLKTVKIKVVGPPPEGVFAEATSEQIEVTWDNPYACEDAMNEYFDGFSVWRRIGSNPFPIDTCTPGLAGKGYTKLTVFPVEDIVDDRYYFLDLDVERGRTYCYRILGNFAQRTDDGFAFNRVESLPSIEKCVQLSRDVPLMTKASVLETDPVNGKIEVRWTKPVVKDLDTLMNPGPYTYELQRAQGITSTGFEPVPGAVFTAENYWQANDTFFFDEGLNTLNSAYTYQVAFYIEGNTEEPLGIASPASSVFLNIASTDETNNLSFDFDVPWENLSYDVYRMIGTEWVYIGSSNEPFYSDQGLLNGVEILLLCGSNRILRN